MLLAGAAMIALPAITYAGIQLRDTSGLELSEQSQAPQTQWVITSAPGLEAILLIGAVGGDVLQQDIYEETIGYIRDNIDPEALAAIDRLDQHLREDLGMLTGPSLAYILSAGDLDSIDSVIVTASNPDEIIRPALEATQGWSSARYEDMVAHLPDAIIALEGLKNLGFDDWYETEYMPSIEAGITRNHDAMAGYNIIPEQKRLLGRDLEHQIEILITAFNMPYGIRILGQRFIGHHQWPADIQLRVAAHEIFHPPFQRQNPDVLAALSELEDDPWVQSIVTNHNPAFGYNSFLGLVDEDSSQALDQLVSERLGFARDPGERWASHDDGMHLLAAAFYHAMKEDGFDQTGGSYQEWLVSAIDRGLLTPEEVRRRATQIVGPDPVQRWYAEMELSDD